MRYPARGPVAVTMGIDGQPIGASRRREIAYRSGEDAEAML